MFESPWPDDLSSADVSFKGRTKTILERNGFYDDPKKFDTVTASNVLSWWNAGPDHGCRTQ